MRLLMVNSATATMWGGGEMWFTEAARWFSDQGHTVQVVGRPRSRFLDAVRESGHDAVDFEFGGDYDPFAVGRALALQMRFRPDVILVNFNKDAWLFGRGAKLMRRRTVARHGLTLFQDKLVHRLVYSWHMDRVIVNAPSIKADYDRLGFDTGKISVILNGVRPVAARPGELRKMLGVSEGTLLVGAAGRLDPQKRFDRYVRIADELRRRDIDARFVLLGDGDERPALEAQVAATSLGDRFIFGGFCPDLAARVGDLDLFLLTSANEGTPNVLLETMSCGVASVAFEIGAVGEMLIDECADGLVADGNEAGMIEATARLLTDSAARARLATAQSRRVNEDLTLEKSMQQYEKLLESMSR